MPSCLRAYSILVALLFFAATASAEQVTVKFREIDDLFANPGKGWMTQQRMPGRAPRLPCSVCYIRVSWEELEPAEGQYNWKVFDDPIAAWGKRGGRIAFRIMTTSAHSRGYYCSPKWLFDAGCKGYEYDRGGGDPTSGGAAIKRIEPDYGDPIYLAKHGKFIAELGRRYDGSDGVEFLDIGSYGIWGEWHTPNAKPWAVRKQIIDMYLSAFKKTPLACMSDDAEALAYCIEHGAGFRRDGVGSTWHEQNWIGSKKYANVKGFAENWTKAPVVFEWFGDYKYLVSRNWPFDQAVDFMLKHHVTLINDNIGNVPKEQWPLVEKLARLSGYRFVLRQIEHADALAAGQTVEIKMSWSNVGVGKLYRPYPLVIYLLDAAGKVVASQPQAQVDATKWLPGDQSVAASLKLPADLKPGEYFLGVAFVDARTSKPAIALAIDSPYENRLYRVSKLAVR